MKKISLYLLLIGSLIGCGPSNTSVNDNSNCNSPLVTKRKLIKKKINRDSLTIGFILDSLINCKDTAFSMGPIDMKNDTMIAKSFLAILEGKKEKNKDVCRWKYYTLGKHDYLSVRYPDCITATFTLRFYSDEIYVFTSHTVAIYLDLKEDIYICFLPYAMGTFPDSGNNTEFYLLDESLFPIAACYSDTGFVRLVTKITHGGAGSLEYHTDYSSILNRNYDSLKYRDILKIKQETLSSAILSGKATPLNPDYCNGPIWLNRAGN